MSDHFRKPVTPKGPTADSSVKASAGMKAAMRAMGAQVEPRSVGGTPIINRPLPAPTLPPQAPTTQQPPAPAAPAAHEPANKPKFDPALALGQNHVASYQALVANDRMAKPPLRAWEDKT